MATSEQSQVFKFSSVFLVLAALNACSFTDVLSAPIPDVLPTEVTPLGINAPISCPPVDPVDPEDKLDCIPEDLNDAIHAAMSTSIKPLVSEYITDGVNGTVINALNALDEAITEAGGILGSLSLTVTGALTPEKISEELESGAQDFEPELVKSIVEYINEGDYDCAIDEGDIMAAAAEYLASAAYSDLVTEQVGMMDVGSIVDNAIATGSFENEAIKDNFDEIRPLIESGLTPVLLTPIVTESLSSTLAEPLVNVPTNTEVTAALAAANSTEPTSPGSRRKRQAMDVDENIQGAIAEIVNCQICGVVKNAIDELIVNAVSDIIASADPVTGSINPALIPDIISSATTAELVGQAVTASVEAGINETTLQTSILTSVIEQLREASSMGPLGIESIPDAISVYVTDEQTETAVTTCVTDYLADTDAVEATISQAVVNAVVSSEAPQTVADSISIPATCTAIVDGLNPALGAVNITSITTAIEDSIIDILTAVLTDPALIDAISDSNQLSLEQVLKKYLIKNKYSPVKINATIEVISGLISGLTSGMENGKEVNGLFRETIASLLVAINESKHTPSISTILQLLLTSNSKAAPSKAVISKAVTSKGVTAKVAAPAIKAVKKVGVSALKKPVLMKAKKVLLFKPFIIKYKKLFFEVDKMWWKLLSKNTNRNKRSILKKKFNLGKKLYGSISNVLQGIQNQFGSIVTWAAAFPPIANGYAYIREISLESIRKDIIEFLAGFDFVDIETLNNFDLFNMSYEDFTNAFDLENMDSSAIITYLADWEDYFDSGFHSSVNSVDQVFKGWKKKFYF